MNLHALANAAIQNVLPNIDVTLKRYAGLTQNAYYERVPSYTTETVSMSVQALNSEGLRVVNNMNLQGEMRSVISPVALRGQSVPDALGGDLLNFEGHDWLVVNVQEIFPDHCKAIVQRQV